MMRAVNLMRWIFAAFETSEQLNEKQKQIRKFFKTFKTILNMQKVMLNSALMVNEGIRLTIKSESDIKL